MSRDFTEHPLVITSGGARLVGILHKAQQNKLIVMCHGFMGSKIENKRLFVEAAREFAASGYNVLRFDFYGSGDSEGDFSDTLISTNIVNLNDVLTWARGEGFEKIAVLGLSMGAATAILTCVDTPVDALVTWSAVPNMKNLFTAYLDDFYDIVREKDWYEFEGWKIKKEFWKDAVQYDISAALAKIDIPKLIVQGTADRPLFIEGFDHFRDIVLPPADFMEVPEAGHTYQTVAHRRQVVRQTLIWFKRFF